MNFSCSNKSLENKHVKPPKYLCFQHIRLILYYVVPTHSALNFEICDLIEQYNSKRFWVVYFNGKVVALSDAK